MGFRCMHTLSHFMATEDASDLVCGTPTFGDIRSERDTNALEVEEG